MIFQDKGIVEMIFCSTMTKNEIEFYIVNLRSFNKSYKFENGLIRFKIIRCIFSSIFGMLIRNG